jgi:hypothetical protein
MYCCPNRFAHSWLKAHVNEHSGRAAAYFRSQFIRPSFSLR